MEDFEPQPIPRALIVADSSVDFDLYIQINDRYVLYTSRYERVKGDSLARLEEGGVDTMYVVAADRSALDTYITEHLRHNLERARDTDDQLVVLRESTYSLLRSNGGTSSKRQALERVRTVAALTVAEITSNVEVVAGLARFVAKQDEDLVRALNVSAYAVALASQRPEFEPEDVLAISAEVLAPAAGTDTAIDDDLPWAASKRTNERDEEAVAKITLLKQQIIALARTFDILTNHPNGMMTLGPFTALRELERRAQRPDIQELLRDFARIVSDMRAEDVESPITPLWRRLGLPEPGEDETDAA